TWKSAGPRWCGGCWHEVELVLPPAADSQRHRRVHRPAAAVPGGAGLGRAVERPRRVGPRPGRARPGALLPPGTPALGGTEPGGPERLPHGQLALARRPVGRQPQPPRAGGAARPEPAPLPQRLAQRYPETPARLRGRPDALLRRRRRLGRRGPAPG